jgi:transposase
MDRGIATADNVKLLRERGYPYAVIRREDESETYRKLFEEGRESFDRVGAGKKSAYGDENKVYVRKLEPEEGSGVCKVLCISDGKERKEQAIHTRKEQVFVNDVSKLDASVKSGNIKSPDKIGAKLEAKIKRHKTVAARFSAEVCLGAGGKAEGVRLTRNEDAEKSLYGCYVIESTHVNLSDKEIWNLYMTLTKVEGAFRAMKSSLGVRPVYHQKADRSGAHLFISVLAYHLLAVIERKLGESGDCREWKTIRRVLSTHTRSTVSIVGADMGVHHIRISGEPEDVHREIYEALGAKDPYKKVVYRTGQGTASSAQNIFST